MSNPSLTSYTPSKSDPSLADALDLLKKNVLLNMNVHHLGTVQSFDETRQTAKATINYKKTFFRLNPQTGVYGQVLVDYPILIDCPVIFLGGGDAALTFPVRVGDECIILFNDRDIDNWFLGAGNGATATSRLHSFADGIILVGVRSLPNVLASFDTTRAVLRNGLGGTTMVGVGETLIKIANNSTTLNTLLQNLITAIESITVSGVTTGGGVSGPPVNAAVFATIATQIAGLLE